MLRWVVVDETSLDAADIVKIRNPVIFYDMRKEYDYEQTAEKEVWVKLQYFHPTQEKWKDIVLMAPAKGEFDVVNEESPLASHGKEE